MNKVYKITNTINSELYIGKTKGSVDVRLNEHIKEANKGSEYYLHRAIRKYGIKNFKIEQVEEGIVYIKINEREKYWIKFYNTFKGRGYNMTEGGDGWSNPSEETISKRVKTKTDKGIHKLSAEKAANTMNSTILENGLSIKEDRLNKRHIKMSEIGEDGLSGYSRARAKQIKTKTLYNFKILDKDENIVVEFVGFKDKIFENTEFPIKIFWNLKGKYQISNNTRKGNIQYEGYTAIKEKV